MLMFIADKEHFYRREIVLNVCNNNASINKSITRFLELGYIKVFKDRTYKSPRLYTITGDGLKMHNKFVRMLERGYAKRDPDIYTVIDYRKQIKQIRKSNFNSI